MKNYFEINIDKNEISLDIDNFNMKPLETSGEQTFLFFYKNTYLLTITYDIQFDDIDISNINEPNCITRSAINIELLSCTFCKKKTGIIEPCPYITNLQHLYTKIKQYV